MKSYFNTPDLDLARARDDLRRALPVVLAHEGARYLLLSLERLDGHLLTAFDQLNRSDFAHHSTDDRVLITGQRAEILRIGSKGRSVVSLARPAWTYSGAEAAKALPHLELVALADPGQDAETFLRGPYERLNQADGPVERAAIVLLKAARLLPAGLLRPVARSPEGATVVSVADVLPLADAQAHSLEVVARAKLPVEDAPDSQLVAFRSVDGGMEHMALVIGEWGADHAPLVRLHSECFTGDLLGSLKCDCGTQLKKAIARIRADGGGVLLYLAQEGRGIGLMSKLRAYGLQDQGFDTVDANLRLGFESDERDFAPAAQMLKLLDIPRIRLMTNNPDKIAGLRRLGIDVADRVAHQFPTNVHNHQYLATKRDRSGHLIADLPPDVADLSPADRAERGADSAD